MNTLSCGMGSRMYSYWHWLSINGLADSNPTEELELSCRPAFLFTQEVCLFPAILTPLFPVPQTPPLSLSLLPLHPFNPQRLTTRQTCTEKDLAQVASTFTTCTVWFAVLTQHPKSWRGECPITILPETLRKTGVILCFVRCMHSLFLNSVQLFLVFIIFLLFFFCGTRKKLYHGAYPFLKNVL